MVSTKKGTSNIIQGTFTKRKNHSSYLPSAQTLLIYCCLPYRKYNHYRTNHTEEVAYTVILLYYNNIQMDNELHKLHYWASIVKN